MNRLTSLGHDLAGTASDQSFGFGYNPASQIVSRSSASDAYAYTGAANVSRGYSVNGLNQYTAVAGNTYTYDANGNLTFDGTSSYTYDAENRLVSRSTGVSLAYDPNGRLWQVSAPTGTSRFEYDGDRLIQEYDGSGTRTRLYGHGAGADEPLAWWENVSGAWQFRFLHADHQGSVIAATDGAGNMVGINAYDPWGVPNSTSIATVGRFGYTGQAWLPELGMYYYKARIYSPMLGRFLQTDPIGYKDQVNLYAYVGNDPVDGRDPSGLEVDAIYDQKTGIVFARDRDSGRMAVATDSRSGFSGGGAIPPGQYAMLEQAQSAHNEVRLERYDGRFGDDKTPEGREFLRLHPGHISYGCITMCNLAQGNTVMSLIKSTHTHESAVDRRGLLGSLGLKESVKNYGNLVTTSGALSIDKKGDLQYARSVTGSRLPQIQYVCHVDKSGACTR